MWGNVRANPGTGSADRPPTARAALAVVVATASLLVGCSPEGEPTTISSSAPATTTVTITVTTATTLAPPPIDVDERYWEMRERDIEIVQNGRRIVFDTWFFAQLDDLGNVSVYEGDELVFSGRVADSLFENAASDLAIRDPANGDVIARISREEFDAAVDAIAEEYGFSV
jgi:hypothetical protein